MEKLRYFAVYKPFEMMCQFSREGDKKTLADLGDFPKDVYPVGRLDFDSEGLLILTNDKRLNHKLLDPKFKHEREYWAQVEGNISEEALADLQKGVIIRINKKDHTTLPAKAHKIFPAPEVPERVPPIRFRINVPDSWLSLTLSEGKNRQVRRMTAKVGFPTLRLIRYRIGKLTLQNMTPGDVKELSNQLAYSLLLGQKY